MGHTAGSDQLQDHLDCLIVMCPPWDTSQPPINLAYLASFARSRGFEVAAWDLNIKMHELARTMELRELWQTMSQNSISGEELAERFFERAGGIITGFVRRIIGVGAPVVGFSVHSRNVYFTVRLVNALRGAAPELKIIFGGPEVSLCHALGGIERLNADAYVIGEGEETLAEALAVFRESGELAPVPGMMLAGADPGALEPRPTLRDLDVLPFPSWDDFDLSWYDRPNVDPSVPFLLSRGCTGQCRFCMDHVISGRHRIRSAENAVAEIEQVIAHHDVRHFHFNDLICNGSPRKLREFAELVVERGLDIGWWSYAVVRRGMDEELFAALKRSGCSALVFGLESGSTTTLKLMNKYYTAEQAEPVLAACAGSGINTGINVIVGFPGETEREHRETLAFLQRNRENIHRVVNLGTCLISPGTDLDLRPEAYGIVHDEERGTWYTEDGNTVEERNRRLNEVEEQLASLHIPRIIVNREMGLGQFTVEDGGGAEQRSVEQPVRLYDVQFLDIADEARQEFVTGEFMCVLLRFRVMEPLLDPMVRVQIFNDEVPGGRNIFIFGMNNDRVHMRLGEVAPGKLEVRLNLYELKLLPGKYKVTLGIWPSEDAQMAYDVRHGSTVFYVGGVPDECGAKVALAARWGEPRPAQEAPAGETAVHSLTLHDREGLELEAFPTGEMLRARMQCEISAPEELELRVLLEQDGLTLGHCRRSDGELSAGRQTVELTIDELPLLQGSYSLAAELLRRGAREVVARRDVPLRVSSSGPDGAGVAHLPSRWEVATRAWSADSDR